jgi:predicted porin
MKKSLVALAALAVVGAASAQSSVTLFGVVDATLAYGSGDVSNKTQLTNSGYNSSRLGFKGVEDLGGGMKAGFWLEAGVNNDNGSFGATNLYNQAAGTTATGGGGMTFNRRSTVSLMGNFGEIRLGRDYTPQFWSETVYDPFGTNGVGTTRTLGPGGVTAVRASNSFAYLSPAMGGFGVWVQGYMGENASNAVNSSAGNGGAIRITYDGGPLSAALAFSQTNVASGLDLKSTNIGISYNLGMATLEGLVTKETQDNWADDANGYLLGALVPMGPGTIRVAFSGIKQGDYKTDQFAIGYVYDLSKRTSLYGTFATVNNGGGASAALNGAVTSVNGSSNGFDLGIKHSF